MSTELVIQMVVGTQVEIDAGKGERALETSAAAAVLGVSLTRFKAFINEGRIKPCLKWKYGSLFLHREVEELRRIRARV